MGMCEAFKKLHWSTTPARKPGSRLGGLDYVQHHHKSTRLLSTTLRRAMTACQCTLVHCSALLMPAPWVGRQSVPECARLGHQPRGPLSHSRWRAGRPQAATKYAYGHVSVTPDSCYQLYYILRLQLVKPLDSSAGRGRGMTSTSDIHCPRSKHISIQLAIHCGMQVLVCQIKLRSLPYGGSSRGRARKPLTWRLCITDTIIP